MKVPNIVGGVRSVSQRMVSLRCPLTRKILCEVPHSTRKDVDHAVACASNAFEKWSNTSVSHRCRLMMNFSQIVREETAALSHTISVEHGKSLQDARGDVFRGLEVIDFATNAASVQMGETVSNVSKDMDCYSYNVPLGVCAGIAPFNFPAMIPLWMIPMAIVTGNTFVLKPSERVPRTAIQIYDYMERAGIPDGVVNIVNGSEEVVEALCDHDAIRAISFVGSTHAGKHIYARASATGKRVQCNMGAQNFAVIMPDAPMESAKAVVSAAFGSSGQRCMAISRVILVGNRAEEWEAKLLEEAEKLTVGSGMEDSDVPPLISEEAKHRVEASITRSISDGADCLLDGRGARVEGFSKGNFVGPTLLKVDPSNRIFKEEVFGPVLQILRCESMKDAIRMINQNEYGNGTSCFTTNGVHAREFQTLVDVGQVGINVALPVPLPMFSFTGWKDSFWGCNHFYGKSGLRFFTKPKTITSKWSANDNSSSTAMPIL